MNHWETGKDGKVGRNSSQETCQNLNGSGSGSFRGNSEGGGTPWVFRKEKEKQDMKKKDETDAFRISCADYDCRRTSDQRAGRGVDSG